MTDKITLNKLSDYIWEIPKSDEMVVPGRVYGDEEIVRHLMHDIEMGKDWNALKQLKNVACLPGIQKYSLAMADIHPGYGYPIGGIGAFEMDTGVLSVAGVGFDINCGVRTLRTHLTKNDVEKVKKELADALFKTVPAGLGSKGDVVLKENELDELLVQGSRFVVDRGYGTEHDLKHTEEEGCVKGADPTAVSQRAKQREHRQIGTLGSGNHYLEVQYVDEVFDEKAAKTYGLFKDQILVSIHCGSRALGHQIGTDYLAELEAASRKYNIPIRDKELVCAPINSQEGQRYLGAVNAGANCAFANRQAIAHLTRKAFQTMGVSPDDIETLYDIGHNNVKKEWHTVDGKRKELMVHRKGSTRAFGPDREEIPADYRHVGQPVLVGGSMGTSSYILHGTKRGMDETFGSAIHGAGRIMSRNQAKGDSRGSDIIKELAAKGILIKGHSMQGIAEEAPNAYKPVEQVVDVMHNTGIAMKVVSVRPLISIKG